MSTDQFGQSPKKETVYSGPSPVSAGGSSYGVATAPRKETVYNGPASGGTVYGGPGTTETAYGPAQSARRAAVSTSSTGGKEANTFFLIAVLSLVNTLLMSSGAMLAMAVGLGITRVIFKQTLISGGDATPVYVLTAALIAVFVALGVFARRGSSTAFLVGMLLYGADTIVLGLDDLAVHIPSIVVHCLFLVAMFRGYRLTKG